MSAASSPDVDLAFGSGIGLHDFSGSPGVSIGREGVFADEFALLAVLKPRDWGASAGQAWLPGLELLAGLFNQAVVSYPTSALAALLFLTNWRGYQMHFLRAAKAGWADGG